MPAKNKLRGNAFEREIVEMAEKIGLEAQRAWGSDGRALGHEAEVDVLVAGLRCQAKRRKAFPGWFKEVVLPTETVEFQAIREDHGKPGYAVMRLDHFLQLVRMAVLYGKAEDSGGSAQW